MRCASNSTVRAGLVSSKVFDTDKIYEQIYGKHFKRQYGEKPTKRYLKLCKKLREAGEVLESDLKRRKPDRDISRIW